MKRGSARGVLAWVLVLILVILLVVLLIGIFSPATIGCYSGSCCFFSCEGDSVDVHFLSIEDNSNSIFVEEEVECWCC